MHYSPPGFNGSKPTDSKLLHALIGFTEVRVVRLGDNHSSVLLNQLARHLVDGFFKTNQDSSFYSRHLENAVSGSKTITAGNHANQIWRNLVEEFTIWNILAERHGAFLVVLVYLSPAWNIEFRAVEILFAAGGNGSENKR